MSTKWLILACTNQVFVFDISKHKKEGDRHYKPPLVKEFLHPESKLKRTELVTDAGGYFSGTSGSNQGKYVPHCDPHVVELENFAKEIARFLEHERTQHHYDQLILCAEPHFHGILNQAISQHVKPLITHHVQKDYVPFVKDMAKVVDEVLP